MTRLLFALGGTGPDNLYFEVHNQNKGNQEEQKDNWSSVENIKELVTGHSSAPSNNFNEYSKESIPLANEAVKDNKTIPSGRPLENPGVTNAEVNQTTAMLEKNSDSRLSWSGEKTINSQDSTDSGNLSSYVV